MFIRFLHLSVVCQCLLDCGVRHVFGGHGGSVVPLINEIIKTNEGGAAGLEWVYCRTEVNAAMCAAAYGKLRSALGVCVGTSGPGASHLVSGAIDAQVRPMSYPRPYLAPSLAPP